LSWQGERDWAHHAWWQFVAVIDEAFAPDRDALLENLQNAGIDARRIYFPMHQLPIYADSAKVERYPVADRVAARAVCLPTWGGLQHDDVRYICDHLLASRVAETRASRQV
jgi:perosamine synthetase